MNVRIRLLLFGTGVISLTACGPRSREETTTTAVAKAHTVRISFENAGQDKDSVRSRYVQLADHTVHGKEPVKNSWDMEWSSLPDSGILIEGNGEQNILYLGTGTEESFRQITLSAKWWVLRNLERAAAHEGVDLSQCRWPWSTRVLPHAETGMMFATRHESGIGAGALVFVRTVVPKRTVTMLIADAPRKLTLSDHRSEPGPSMHSKVHVVPVFFDERHGSGDRCLNVADHTVRSPDQLKAALPSKRVCDLALGLIDAARARISGDGTRNVMLVGEATEQGFRNIVASPKWWVLKNLGSAATREGVDRSKGRSYWSPGVAPEARAGMLIATRHKSGVGASGLVFVQRVGPKNTMALLVASAPAALDNPDHRASNNAK